MTVIFVVMTILLFLTLDAIIRRSRAWRKVVAADIESTPRSTPVRLPDGIFFARSHTWMNLFPSGKIRLGVDDFVGQLLDTPSITYLKGPRELVQKGDPILVLTEGERSLTIRAPIEGEILERNERLVKEPSLLKEMLFSEGWIYTILPNRLSDMKQMLLGDETRRWIAEEFGRLRELLTGEAGGNKTKPVLLQDGGAPVPGALKYVERDTWELFDRTFLRES